MNKVVSIKKQSKEFPAWMDYLSQLLVIVSLVTFTLETDQDFSQSKTLIIIELIIACTFFAEYLLRIHFAEKKRDYLFSFYGIIDFIAFAPQLLTMGFLNLKFLRIFRLVRLLRLFKFVRYNESLTRLKNALFDIKGELITFTFLSLVCIYLSSVGIYFFENEAQPEKFGSIAKSMWWSIATLTTVGYGDVYSITPAGKIFTTVILITGLSTVTIPTELIAASFTSLKKRG